MNAKEAKERVLWQKIPAIVKDDIEFAQGNVIPLWAFGLNY